MPIYEYQCNECGVAFEKMVRFSEAERTPACPKCESQDTHKKISKVGSFGVSLSGSTSSSGSSCGSSGSFR
jgi:putative FmdB family regulatory protein